jgi:Na+-transporting methylmalonyl-CoA/oxaloacetate decarboxylase gamma subunit
MQSRCSGFSQEAPALFVMIFLDRGKDGSDKYLEWKVRFFLLGAALAMAGVGLDSSVLVILAIALLVAGAALRFLPTREAAEDSAEDAAEETAADAPGGAALAEDPDPET